MGAAFKIGSIVVNVRDVPRAMAFWAAALAYVPRYEPEPDWVILRPRDGVGPNLSLNLGETRPLLHPHIHLDLYAHDQVAEIERLVGLGAHRVEDWHYPEGERDFEVLEDPEGNRFCVIDASPDPAAEAASGPVPG
jgi:predicted enzyme related to lactoylglutathione lyase